MSENENGLYICKGCESELENSYGNCDKFAEFEACPMCMTLEELWEAQQASKNTDS